MNPRTIKWGRFLLVGAAALVVAIALVATTQGQGHADTAPVPDYVRSATPRTGITFGTPSAAQLADINKRGVTPDRAVAAAGSYMDLGSPPGGQVFVGVASNNGVLRGQLVYVVLAHGVRSIVGGPAMHDGQPQRAHTAVKDAIVLVDVFDGTVLMSSTL